MKGVSNELGDIPIIPFSDWVERLQVLSADATPEDLSNIVSPA